MLTRKQFHRLLLLNLFTSSHCMLAYIALSTALSYAFSNSVLVFSFFTGLYLMAMGLGVLLAEKIRGDSTRIIRLILINSLAGILLANPGITGLILTSELLRYVLRAMHLDLLFLLFPLGIVLTVLIGMVSGAELPIFSKLIEKENWHVSQPIIGVLTSDYFGAFAGIIVFTFILNPCFGLIPSVLISQMLTLAIIDVTFIYFQLHRQWTKLFLFLCLINLYVAGMLLLSRPLVDMVDTLSRF